MRSLFGRVGKYPGSESDPRENRLTECFAAVLERVDGLAGMLVASWLGVGLDVPVRTSTQRFTPSGWFVDLELAFGTGSVPELLVWVENKHGSPPHGGQLQSYLADIKKVPAEGRHVVLLAPRQTMPDEDVPPEVKKIEWQEVAACMRVWRHSTDHAAEGRFLLDEFSTYLREEGLEDQELTTDLALAFALRAKSEATIRTLIKVADQYVRTQWGERVDDRPDRRRTLERWWAHYPKSEHGAPVSAAWGDANFELALKLDSSRLAGRPRDVDAFVAGLTFGADNPFQGAPDNEWIKALEDQDFVHSHDDRHRMWRYLYPEQLLAHTSLKDQGEALGAFVVDAFRALASSRSDR